MSWDNFVDAIQVISALGVLAAAVAAWRAVKQAKALILLPAKQEHSAQIKGLLDFLVNHSPLNWSEAHIGPMYPMDGPKPDTMPQLTSFVLFEDLGIHIRGFGDKWETMQARLSDYLSFQNDTTTLLAEAVASYFEHPQSNPASNWEILRHLWGRLSPDRTTDLPMEIIEQTPNIHHLHLPGLRVATVTTQIEAEEFKKKYEDFSNAFPNKTEFEKSLAKLREDFSAVNQEMESLTRFLIDAQSTVVFPQECELLGVIKD